MIPVPFDESDIIFDRPDNMTRDECEPVQAKRLVVGSQEIPALVTCWKLTTEEIAHLVAGGRLWVVTVGDQLWPMTFSSEKPF